MADLTITAANVKQSAVTATSQVIASVAISAGQAVGINSSGEYVLADSSNPLITYQGIALCNAASGQPIVIGYQDGSGINIGATISGGMIYAVSHNAGGISPIGDVYLQTSEALKVQIIGIASSDASALILFNPAQNGTAVKPSSE